MVQGNILSLQKVRAGIEDKAKRRPRLHNATPHTMPHHVLHPLFTSSAPRQATHACSHLREPSRRGRGEARRCRAELLGRQKLCERLAAIDLMHGRPHLRPQLLLIKWVWLASGDTLQLQCLEERQDDEQPEGRYWLKMDVQCLVQANTVTAGLAHRNRANSSTVGSGCANRFTSLMLSNTILNEKSTWVVTVSRAENQNTF